ncbi:D-alanyl-D-alanine carboxypeptidase/D-alanyl-D-alanine endopeptidase [Actinomadura atramentaria]|uniref:D-alanyl-D-alanine carboxypeptidase/D-alanyl-D-alanine endopeptidase n=1 Tax=Actinomadura atramentaria TaxID=1990 RepID=UPI000379BEA4|nr:D-alanyl-D-alanine carboxypeptidase/D-alanyl-D-alanine-endopeptidase [Actinomadura atramentaria]
MANFTPERRLAPRPPAVAEREVALTSGGVRAADTGSAPLPNAGTLTARLNAVLGTTKTPVNAVVLDAATGRELFARNADAPATPASTTKIATTVAALASVGPAHRITTRAVQGDGGDVVLVGGGDPTLTALPAAKNAAHPPYASLADLAAQTAAALKARGVAQTRVDYDATAYQGPRTAYGWKPNYLPDGEAAPVSALTVDEGRVDPASRARVQDPPAAAAKTFARLLTRDGVRASAGRSVRAATGAAQLGAVQSPPLSALIEHLLTESDNDVAEAVARQVAIKRGAEPSFAGAAAAVRQVLAGLGVADGVSVNDGSGLSAANRITPHALARLAALAASPDHPELRSVITGMPVAGFSGTLRPPRYTTAQTAAGAGTVHAKTGTLSGVSTLAGITADASGRLLAFAFMAGDGTAPVDPGVLDLLAASVAACGC